MDAPSRTISSINSQAMGEASGCGDLARVGVRRDVAGDGAAHADDLLPGVRNSSELDQDLEPGLGLLAGQFGLCLGFGHCYIDHEVESLSDVPSR